MSLARKAVVAAYWQVGASMGARVIGLVGTFLLTRILVPEQLGGVWAASILVLTANLLSNASLGQWVVYKRDLEPSGVFQATSVSVTLALVGAIAVIFLAQPLGPYFNAGDLTPYIPGLALAMLFERIGEMPERVLTRELRFKVIGTGNAVGELSYTVVTLGLAAAGFGGMAVVWGNIAQWGLRLLVFAGALKRSDWLVPARLNPALIREMFRYGLPLAGAQLARHVGGKWDRLLVSKVYGSGTMGLYNMAYNFAEIPALQVGDAILDVLMPSFARVDRDARKQALVRSVGLLALIVFPLAAGLAAVSDTLVATLFDEAWQGIAPFLVVLASVSIFQPLPNAIVVYLKSSGRPRPTLVLQIIHLLAVLILVWSLAQVSVMAAAMGAAGAALLRLLLAAWFVVRTDQVPAKGLFNATIPVLAACFGMFAAVRVFEQLLGWSPSWFLLGLDIGVGTVVYIALAFVLCPSIARDFIDLVRRSAR